MVAPDTMSKLAETWKKEKGQTCKKMKKKER